MNLENLKRQAQEAAKSPFLWELGMRLESPRQAFRITQTLSGLSNEDEKKIRAVAKLRIESPETLLEIMRDAADKGEGSMPEVMFGREHYTKLAHQKDEELWNKIATNLAISRWVDIHPKVRNGEITTQEELPPILFNISYDMRESGIEFVVPYIATAPSSLDLPNIKFGKYNDGSEIRVRPLELDLQYTRLHASQINSECMANSFYDNRPVASGSSPRSPQWRMAVVSVSDGQFLNLAKKIARAYEAETARRRKPAKAVVLKNY